MKTGIRWGAWLVIAAASPAALANGGARVDASRVEQRTGLMMERYPDTEVKVKGRAGAANGAASPADEKRRDRIVVRVARTTDDGAAKAGTASGAPADAKDERASFDERWLHDREGYRDGGY